MSEPSFDADGCPRGSAGGRGWSGRSATDDRSERYYLEMKSQADLITKVDWSKVAKFILGAGNRMPDRAARYFDRPPCNGPRRRS